MYIETGFIVRICGVYIRTDREACLISAGCECFDFTQPQNCFYPPTLSS